MEQMLSVILTPKMKAFLELEQMLVPVQQELDYDEELAEARREMYGYGRVSEDIEKVMDEEEYYDIGRC